MKKIYSCFIILTFFASCTSDGTNVQEIDPTIMRGEGDVVPAYSANPHDNAGQIYDALFDAYYDGTSRTKEVHSVIADVESIANANTSFIGIKDSGYLPLSPERVQYLADRSNEDISAIVGASGLSAAAKVSFSNFLISIVALYDSETDALTMCSAVIKYEETVLNNNLLTDNDRRVILTTTSIIRYSSYRAKKKPKKNTDPYWIIFVGHVFGSEEGAEEGTAKAIVEGLVTGIVSNK